MLKALGTKLVLERIERPQTTQAGIFISNSTDPNPVAKIVSKGDAVKIAVEVGDIVAVSWHNTAQHQTQGQTVYIVDESGVFAKELPND
jgi:co-chaperonin GroES (HSP10)